MLACGSEFFNSISPNTWLNTNIIYDQNNAFHYVDNDTLQGHGLYDDYDDWINIGNSARCLNNTMSVSPSLTTQGITGTVQLPAQVNLEYPGLSAFPDPSIANGLSDITDKFSYCFAYAGNRGSHFNRYEPMYDRDTVLPNIPMRASHMFENSCLSANANIYLSPSCKNCYRMFRFAFKNLYYKQGTLYTTNIYLCDGIENAVSMFYGIGRGDSYIFTYSSPVLHNFNQVTTWANCYNMFGSTIRRSIYLDSTESPYQLFNENVTNLTDCRNMFYNTTLKVQNKLTPYMNIRIPNSVQNLYAMFHNTGIQFWNAQSNVYDGYNSEKLYLFIPSRFNVYGSVGNFFDNMNWVDGGQHIFQYNHVYWY